MSVKFFGSHLESRKKIGVDLAAFNHVNGAANDYPVEGTRGVVLRTVVADAGPAGVPAAGPGAAFPLKRDLVLGPRQIEPPLPRGVERILLHAPAEAAADDEGQHHPLPEFHFFHPTPSPKWPRGQSHFTG